jgi:8-oxo-dGTP pyrophosphatase MutT (NUDIX family)
MERVIVVDAKGKFERIIPKNETNANTIIAVELVLIILTDEKKVLLLNRGKGATDMQSKWALHSGKIIDKDLTIKDEFGKVLTIDANKNAAIREFKEELDFALNPERLEIITQFYMPEKDKKLYFTLFALDLKKNELEHMYPDFSEIEGTSLFTLDEFISNDRLGDAIKFKKNFIVEYLRKRNF